MKTKRATGLLCAVVWGFASCASDHAPADSHTPGVDADAVVDGSAGSDSLPNHDSAIEPAGECHWPSSLDALGSNTREVCRAARAFLSCETAGGGVACPSDDFSTCETTAEIESSLRNCKSNCEVDEYVALCGGVGPGPIPEPPAGCRRHSLANPAGVILYCCPCG